MKIVIAAGGTGGHIFPALATIVEMKKLHSQCEPIWVTTTRSREKELAEQYGVTPLFLQVEGIKRSISLQPVKAVLKFVKAFFQMKKYLKSNDVERVIAFGGYVCAPVLLAAKVLNIPYFLQEQNSVPGLVNRIFANGAKKTFLGVPIVEQFTVKGKTDLTGTPIRHREISYNTFEFPFEIASNKKVVLICGGSQGAQSMNRVLVKAVHWMAEQGIVTIWQSGGPGLNELLEHFKGNPNVYCVASMDDLYPYYDRADLLVGRSGASTMSEAALFGLPSILIPLPWSAENHQWFNAGFGEKEGWVLRLVQCDETSDQVIESVKELLVDGGSKYSEMKHAAEQAARPDAAVVIAKEVLSC